MKKIFFVFILSLFNLLFALEISQKNSFQLEINDCSNIEECFIEIKSENISISTLAENFFLRIGNDLFPCGYGEKQISPVSKWDINGNPGELCKLKGNNTVLIESDKEIYCSDMSIIKKGKKCIITLNNIEFGFDKNNFASKLSDVDFIEKLNEGDVIELFKDVEEIKNLRSPLQKKNFINSDRYKYYQNRIERYKKIIADEKIELLNNNRDFIYHVLYPLNNYEYDLENQGYWLKVATEEEFSKKIIDSRFYYKNIKGVIKNGDVYVLLKMPEEYATWLEENGFFLSLNFNIKGIVEIAEKKYVEIDNPCIGIYYEASEIRIFKSSRNTYYKEPSWYSNKVKLIDISF